MPLLGGNADRWRAHIKTAKLAYTLRMLVERGIRNFKCATTLELLVACQSGAADVLLGLSSDGCKCTPRARDRGAVSGRAHFRSGRERRAQVRQWQGSRLGVFLDINPGMNRTGIEQSHGSEAAKLVHAIGANGLEFRGLHYYDGQYRRPDERERTAAAHEGYDRLLRIVS